MKRNPSSSDHTVIIIVTILDIIFLIAWLVGLKLLGDAPHAMPFLNTMRNIVVGLTITVVGYAITSTELRRMLPAASIGVLVVQTKELFETVRYLVAFFWDS